MSDAAAQQANQQTATQDIVVDEVFPHAPETIWRTLTDGALMARWLMAPTGFEAVKGNRFTYQTKPGGAWDGVIHCEVLEVVPHQRFVYSWKGGHPDNVGYGAPLDTIVTWTLTKVGVGTRVRLVHSGFVMPRNESALRTMGEGWKKVVPKLGEIAGAQD
ncbi:MAG TPA: SRPBCC domain-containing protein [Dongiaceae bacterium]|nr:SRPBCC domain-containing protein [Dongiaceae bacterium]